MRDIFIEHNPYKMETKILVDKEPVKENSRLHFARRPFQEWVENLPEVLMEECNDDTFHVTFHGTLMDFEDLQSVAADAEKELDVKMICEHQPAREVKDKEAAIDKLFQEIKTNPYFEELKSPDVIQAFEIARSREFPVDVIATMSAGKSTLINALLGQKLMPAKNEACTATITEIHDTDESHFQADVYDTAGKKFKSVDPLNLSEMEALNQDSRVFKIRARGDIPFVSAEEMALVLVDTPGPNNARTEAHRAATYRMLSESSKPLILYVLNARQLGINDDSQLLNQVAESMKVGGKQSKDRYIFVLNQVDAFKSGEDSVEEAIHHAEDYLSTKGIENPNIYPASALTALNIREYRDAVFNVQEMAARMTDANYISVFQQIVNLNSNFHLETFAPLPPSLKEELEEQMKTAQSAGNVKEEALIHSGIPAIEAAVRLYVDKYARTAKIRGIVDTFEHRLESQQFFERTARKIAENKEKQEEIRQTIQAMREKISDAKSAKAFKETIQALDCSNEIRDIKRSATKKSNAAIEVQLKGTGNRKLSVSEAKNICAGYARYVKDLQAEIYTELGKQINDFLNQKSKELMDSYRERLKSFAEDVPGQALQLDPVKIMAGRLSVFDNLENMIADATKTEKVKVGERWVENEDKHWYKPWTWFDSDGWWEDVYKDQEYVDAKKLGDAFFAPVQEALMVNINNAGESAEKQVEIIKEQFLRQFRQLDQQLNKKLKELEQCIASEADVEKTIEETAKRLDWLKDIRRRLNAILDI